LLPFLKLKQKRVLHQVKLGDRQIAELSLDQVSLKSETREKLYNELEVELKTEGDTSRFAGYCGIPNGKLQP